MSFNNIKMLVILVFYSSYIACSCNAQNTPSTAEKEQAIALSPSQYDYTYGYWLNGYRKQENDHSANVLAFETSHYAVHLNLDDIPSLKFGKFFHKLSYKEALSAPIDQSKDLKNATLLIEIEHQGKTYKAVSAKASSLNQPSLARIWESGRYLQHFDIIGLNFKTELGEEIFCRADFDIKVTPRALQLTSTFLPAQNYESGTQKGIIGQALSILLMTRRGEKSKKWKWTNADWGGDWLDLTEI